MLKIQDKKTNSLEKVKEIYESGKYFDEAYEWYSLRFLSPYSDRIFFSFLFAISVVIVFVVSVTIYNLFPLNEAFPVLVKQEDASVYRANIVNLRPENLDYNTNESIGRHLAMYYVKILLDNSYSSNDLSVLKNKLSILKKFSNVDAYNKASTYLNGVAKLIFQDARKEKLVLKRVKFLDDSSFKINNFYRVEFFYDLIITDNEIEKPTKNSYKINLTFKFNDIRYDKNKDEFNPIVFMVNDFKITKLK